MARGSGGKAPEKFSPTTPTTFTLDATNTLFLSRNATEWVQMYSRFISYLKVPQEYSKIVVKMKWLSNNNAIWGNAFAI